MINDKSNVKLFIITVLFCIGVLCVFCFANNTGETSKQWKVVYTPCVWCGKTNNLNIHHVYPQAAYPQHKNNTSFMVSLCRTDGKGCHYYIGHHGKGWKFVFTNVMGVINARTN